MEEQLWEEDFIERCVQELLEEEEQWEWFIPSRDLLPQRQEQVGLRVLHQDVHQDADFDIVVVSPTSVQSEEREVQPQETFLTSCCPSRLTSVFFFFSPRSTAG